MTQLQLARAANITVSYIWKLESAGAAPDIDLVDRLANALGTTAQDLLPESPSPDTLAILQEQAQRLFASILHAADRETLPMLNPLLARLAEAPTTSR